MFLIAFSCRGYKRKAVKIFLQFSILSMLEENSTRKAFFENPQAEKKARPTADRAGLHAVQENREDSNVTSASEMHMLAGMMLAPEVL